MQVQVGPVTLTVPENETVKVTPAGGKTLVVDEQRPSNNVSELHVIRLTPTEFHDLKGLMEVSHMDEFWPWAQRYFDQGGFTYNVEGLRQSLLKQVSR